MTSLAKAGRTMSPAIAQAPTGGVMDFKRLFGDAIIPILGDLCVRYDLDQKEMDELIDFACTYYRSITDEFRREHGLRVKVGRPSDVVGLGLWR